MGVTQAVGRSGRRAFTRVAHLLSSAGVLLLLACGGGGESAPQAWSAPSASAFGTRVPFQATGAVDQATAAVADALVAWVNQGAENWAETQVITASLLGAGAINPQVFAELDAPAHTDVAEAFEGATALCGSGSASVQAEAAFVARILRSQGLAWQAGDRFNLNFRHCVVDDGSIGLAQLPGGSQLSGGIEVAVSRYNAAADYAATLTLVNLQLSRPSGARLVVDLARFAVDYTARAMRTVLDTGTQAYIDGQVAVQGQTVWVTMGVWRSVAPPGLAGLSGWFDLDYSNWRYDRAVQRASAGSVEVLGHRGVIASVSARPEGGYTVRLANESAGQPVVFDCPPHQGCVGLPG